MKLYINDKYLHLVRESDAGSTHSSPDFRLSSFHGISPASLSGVVLLEHTTEDDITQILNWIEFKKIPKVQTLICLTTEFKQVKSFIKSQFRIVEAAGGLVRKRDKFLLIFRLGKWDLPKGKLEKGEKAKIAAVREVMEECAVEAELVDKLCTTWHTYMQEGKRILKKTTWYNMNCLNDANMEPQYIENIEDIRWMTIDQADHALKNSYRSIQGVMESWKRHKPESI
jgi:ADP-ribose pyrophosphatase YjhB (NUDIX family)